MMTFVLKTISFFPQKEYPNANYVFTYYNSEEVVREGVMNLADFNDGVEFRVLKNVLAGYLETPSVLLRQSISSFLFYLHKFSILLKFCA